MLPPPVLPQLRVSGLEHLALGGSTLVNPARFVQLISLLQGAANDPTIGYSRRYTYKLTGYVPVTPP